MFFIVLLHFLCEMENLNNLIPRLRTGDGGAGYDTLVTGAEFVRKAVVQRFLSFSFCSASL